jgi:hypothetical protein
MVGSSEGLGLISRLVLERWYATVSGPMLSSHAMRATLDEARD